MLGGSGVLCWVGVVWCSPCHLVQAVQCQGKGHALVHVRGGREPMTDQMGGLGLKRGVNCREAYRQA